VKKKEKNFAICVDGRGGQCDSLGMEATTATATTNIMQYIKNPTSGRGTRVWMRIYAGTTPHHVISGWLLSMDDVRKTSRVWFGSELCTVPTGSLYLAQPSLATF
jgi:hypothetical protein